LRNRALFQSLNDEELAFLQRFKSGELVVEAGTTLILEGSSSPQLYTALHGMGLRHKTLPDGRRQVLNFVFPGDFIGLQAAVMGEMKHTVEATSAMTLCVFKRADLWTLFRSYPGRAFDLTWLAAIEEHLLGETLAYVGQRSAISRVAWALVRVYRRAEALGLVVRRAAPFPYRQQDLADALGLSLVHTNKTLRRLHDRQLVAWSNGDLKINDLAALSEIADLSMEPLPQRPLI
jgi:CRP-like cAMP-binding protein